LYKAAHSIVDKIRTRSISEVSAHQSIELIVNKGRFLRLTVDVSTGIAYAVIFEEFYCPSVEWEWGDGTKSESSSDCAPYEPGKSEIKRRFTVEHVFRAGAYRVMFHLKRRDKSVGAASVNIQVRPGLRDGIQ